MLRYAVDEDFDNRIVRGLLRLLPTLDVVRVQDAGLRGKGDLEVLEWAANENRVLLTHDASTMTKHAYTRVESARQMPGVFEVGQEMPIGEAIADLILVATCSPPYRRESDRYQRRDDDPTRTAARTRQRPTRRKPEGRDILRRASSLHSNCRAHSKMGDLFQRWANPLSFAFQVVRRLQVQPEALGCSEKPGQSQCGICGNGSLTQNDLVDPSSWYVDPGGQPVLREVHWLQKFLGKNLAWMNRRTTCLLTSRPFSDSRRFRLPLHRSPSN